MGFTRAELAGFAGRSIDDVLGDDVRLLMVGINPGLWSAAVNAHFARPGNRFWPALHAAGITPYLVDTRDGMRDADRQLLIDRGIGLTNVVARASAVASDLGTAEVRAAAGRLEQRIAQLRPRVVAVLGIGTYRIGFDPKATAGRQDRLLGGSPVWVVPNPSGLNAHETVASLAAAYAEPAREAGIDLS